VVYSFCGLTLKDIRKLQRDNTKLKNKLRKLKVEEECGVWPPPPRAFCQVRHENMTATEVIRRQQERGAEQNAVMKDSVENIVEVMLAPLLNGALEREADKVSKLMEDIKLLQDSEAALKNEVVILQKINIESAGQILALEEQNENLEQELIAATEQEE
jgi:hypothetical protein